MLQVPNKEYQVFCRDNICAEKCRAWFVVEALLGIIIHVLDFPAILRDSSKQIYILFVSQDGHRIFACVALSKARWVIGIVQLYDWCRDPP